MKTTRKLTMAAVGLLALVATTDLIMSPAMAQPPPGPPGGPPPGGGPRPGGGGGWIGPAIVGGAILGGMAATARPGYARECWYEKRRVVDEYGRRYIRRVRVCS
jgi:hypothetical protein